MTTWECLESEFYSYINSKEGDAYDSETYYWLRLKIKSRCDEIDHLNNRISQLEEELSIVRKHLHEVCRIESRQPATKGT